MIFHRFLMDFGSLNPWKWAPRPGETLIFAKSSFSILARFWSILAPIFDRFWGRCLMFRPLVAHFWDRSLLLFTLSFFPSFLQPMHLFVPPSFHRCFPLSLVPFRIWVLAFLWHVRRSPFPQRPSTVLHVFVRLFIHRGLRQAQQH